MRKTLIPLIIAALPFNALAEFKPGEKIRLTRDEPLLFRDQFVRLAKAGQEFTVQLHHTQSHKIYLAVKDVTGKLVALNIKEDAAEAVPPPPAPEPQRPPEPPKPAEPEPKKPELATVDGFAGIPWGATREKVKEAMLNKKGVEPDLENNDEKLLTFLGGEFEGKRALRWVLVFLDDKMCRGAVHTAVDEVTPIKSYEEIRDLLTSKFGKPATSVETLREPYTRGDGYEVSAVRTGKADFSASWEHKQPSGDAAIKCTLTPKAGVRVSFEDVKLMTEFSEKHKDVQPDEL